MYKVEIICVGDPLDERAQIIATAHPDMSLERWNALGRHLLDMKQEVNTSFTKLDIGDDDA